MAGFKLTKGTDTFEFDALGTVNDSTGKKTGTWGTNNKNQIVLKKDAGGETPFDVKWKFNANNHLVINDGNADVFNFDTVLGNVPRYETRDAVLKVRPHTNNVFGFDLRGEWDLSETHDLSITINGEKSVIDGFIKDERSRFMFHFFNKKDLSRESILGFVGEWALNQTAVDAGTPRLDFKYKREDGTLDTFELPKAVVVRGFNQLMYEYNKKGLKRIQFQGEISFSERGEISYLIDRQTTGAGESQVKETTLTIKAKFNPKNPATGDGGELDFIVSKKDGSTPGAGATSLTLKGKYAGVLGSTHLQVGFQFEQVRGANSITRKIGFDGKLSWDGGTTITFDFAKDTAAKSTSITISLADIKLGAARGDARLNITAANGKVTGVEALFGFSF
ncbi:MAG: hypothetical protein JO360_03480 [Acidobacteria bacterium]|nr:hypothetical protein [Acidobacteriota bacterium]